jgi:hypothetical protein
VPCLPWETARSLAHDGWEAGLNLPAGDRNRVAPPDRSVARGAVAIAEKVSARPGPSPVRGWRRGRREPPLLPGWLAPRLRRRAQTLRQRARGRRLATFRAGGADGRAPASTRTAHGDRSCAAAPRLFANRSLLTGDSALLTEHSIGTLGKPRDRIHPGTEASADGCVNTTNAAGGFPVPARGQ